MVERRAAAPMRSALEACWSASKCVSLTALLASAALLLHSFVNVMTAERGYQVERILTTDLSPSGQRYADAARRVAFYGELVDRVRALPGVLSAGAISELPAVRAESGASRTIFYTADTDARSLMLARPVAMIRGVTTGYFAASGTGLRAGRLLTDDERVDVAVISESLARRLWPGEPAHAVIGRQFRQGDVKAPAVTITGVVEDARPGGVDREPPPVIYRPYPQWASGPMTLLGADRGRAVVARAWRPLCHTRDGRRSAARRTSDDERSRRVDGRRAAFSDDVDGHLWTRRARTWRGRSLRCRRAIRSHAERARLACAWRSAPAAPMSCGPSSRKGCRQWSLALRWDWREPSRLPAPCAACSMALRRPIPWRLVLSWSCSSLHRRSHAPFLHGARRRSIRSWRFDINK